MDWFTSSKSSSSSRPMKTVEFYQRKVVSFLFSAEGRDDFRCLNIPLSQLGFYSPLHFIGCIPLEMCEPFKNDKLFLATSGELRKGDKVLLLERGTEGIIRSAVFKGRRMGNSSEPEILLDGHRKTYSEEEVVPYKAHLRQHLGTSLVPEKDFDISNGVLQWEEPSWEPGQEVYYKPEKRWGTILSHETNQRGRLVAAIKMDGTNLKKEKVIRVSLNELQEHGVPVRIPKRLVQGNPILLSDSSCGGSSTRSDPPTPIGDEYPNPPSSGPDENEKEVTEIYHSPPTTTSSTKYQETKSKKVEKKKVQIEQNETFDSSVKSSGVPVTYEQYNGSPVTPTKRFSVQERSQTPPPPLPTSPPPSKDQRYDTRHISKLTETQQDESFSSQPPEVPYRKKSSKRSVRPATEYYQPTSSSSPRLQETSNIYHDPDTLKSKSYNNLDLTASDDDLEAFQLVNYTNSLRSSARKLMQKQLAYDSNNRAASLKLRPATSRPHVAEIFAWDYDKMKMTKRVEPVVTSYQPIYTKPTPSYKTATVSVCNSSTASNNLSKCRSQPDIQQKRDEVDQTMSASLYSRPHSSMQQRQQVNKPNPLDFNFLPLSSSDLVKRQLAVVNRVLERPGNKSTSPEFSSPSPSTQLHDNACMSSDSSSHENDSGRGSYQYIPDTIKESEKITTKYVIPSPKHQQHPNTVDSNNKYCHSPLMESNQQESYNSSINTVNRRYLKNRSTSRSSSLPRHMSSRDDKDLIEEEQYSVPMPFNPGSLAAVSGLEKGIQGATHSSYADATLCALFSCSNIFDMDLLFSKPGHIERGIKKEIRKILREKIVTPLRLNAYCKAENVTHLREAMLPLSSKMHSPLMDAQEFLYLLFDSALMTESFIEFSNGTKDFMHQIIARPKDRSKSQTVQFMLETSLGTSGLKFKQMPSPALFLCMPRCKGRLVYYEAVIPTLQLNVTRLLQKGPKQCVCEMAATLQCAICHKKNGDMALDFCEVCKGIADQIHFRLDHQPVLTPKSQKDELLNLHSIICTRGNRFVAFVKVTEHRLSPWLFFDSMVGENPEVTLLEDFGRWLDSLEKQPGHYREFAKLHPLLRRIMTDSHIYIYSKSHLTNSPEQTESLVI